MNDRKDVKRFVQHTLGCRCPEEVFEKIEHRTDVEVSGRIRLSEKITVGDRLLIYVVEIDDVDALNDTLPVLIPAGREERDSEGLNRFRLVIYTGGVPELKAIADEIFNNSKDVDERVHLHFITKDEFDTLDIN